MAFVKTHLPCPECGGSDPASLNEDGSMYCFSCDKLIPNHDNSISPTPIEFKTYKNNSVNTSDGSFNALTDRSISLDTAKKYGVKSILNSKGEVDTHIYPYYNVNEIGAFKLRDTNKTFFWQGSSTGTGLFGQQLFQEGGKYITITEGECDAMAAYELLGSKWPVVSLKNGAAGAVRDIKSSLEFLEKFDKIVINFDSDTSGREAARKAARLFTPGKALILSLPEEFKDANDMLRSGNHKAYTIAWWASKTYTPSGIMSAKDILSKYHDRPEKESIPYPWHGLNEKLYGLRTGELVTVTGGTGLGKSSITRELEHWLIKNTQDNVGIIALEEDYYKTADCLVSIEANARLYIDHIRKEYPKDQLDTMLANLFGNDRVWIHSHFGSNDIDEIFAKVRYMIVGLDCKWVVVDHLHMLLSASAEGDERRTIDTIMHKLRSIVEETNAGLILVSHLKRIEGNRGHENGVTVNLSHLRGSQSIAQLSDCVLALERNQQSDDPNEANTTHVRVLKSRYTGDVGMATHLMYDKETGRLSEIIDYEDELEDADEAL
jgi:twinkle protein